MNQYELNKEAFAEQSRLILETIQPLAAQQWHGPTRLEGWDVFTLVAHIRRSLLTVIDYGAKPLDAAPTVDRISYWNFDGAAIAEAVTERTKQSSAHLSADTMAGEFAARLSEALVVLENGQPETVIHSIFGPMKLVEFVATRVVELTVHSLDLFDALGLAPRLHPSAQAVTVEILERLCKQSRPAVLADDLDFIEAAAGRKRYEGLEIAAFN